MNLSTVPKAKLNRITLNFSNGRESEYRNYFFEQSYKTTRGAYLILAIMYALFGYVDSVVAYEFLTLFLTIRLIVVSVLLFVFFYSFSNNFKLYWQSLLFISYFIGAIGIIIMLIKIPEVTIYSSGLVLVFLAGSVLIKLRFFAVSIANAIVIVIYIIAAFVWNIEFKTIISVSFFLIGADLIGMLAAYRTEFFHRQNFTLYIQIAKKNKEIEQSNKNLENKVMERTELLNSRNKELKKEVKRRALIQKELVAAKEKAEESDKLKSAFLANMSHEIRTPMNGILGFANILREAESEEELNEFIDIIIRSGEHLLNLINDIIDLSKIEAGILKIEKSKFQLNFLTKEIYHMFMYDENIVSKGIVLSYKDGLPDDDSEIYTDRMRLKQVMINLVHNACKYTDKGSITFSYSIVDESLVFVIKDTGIGIKEELQKHIFDRFMQVSLSRTSGRDSTGLGLAISKTYLKLMGGSISVKSKLGQGSQFTFVLPGVFNFNPTNGHSKQTKEID